jgi:hypothetical protein
LQRRQTAAANFSQIACYAVARYSKYDECEKKFLKTRFLL